MAGLFGIDHFCILSPFGLGGWCGGLFTLIAHQMNDFVSAQKQIVCDDAAVAAPPHSFRAHDGNYTTLAEFDEFVKGLSELLGKCIVGVIVKACAAAECVD